MKLAIQRAAFRPACHFTLTALNTAAAATLLCSLQSHAAIAPGDLVITELMANPASVSDSAGEWFEVYNRSGTTLDLSGLTLSDSGSNSHTVSGTVTVAADSYFVFGRNADIAANGGYQANYAYSNFTLGNSSDDIILSMAGVTIDSLSYAGDSNFGIAGVSTELTSTGFLATPAGLVYGNGDTGTPGAAGSDPQLNLNAVSPVPVPAAGWLMASALTGLIGQRRLRRH